MKKMTLKLKKKHGSITDLLGASICLMCLMAVMFGLVCFSAMVDYKREINAKTRSALLLLEQQGEMKKTDVDSFISELQGLFLADSTDPVITLTVNGSPIKANGASVMAYNGDEVSIRVEIVVSYRHLGLSRIWGIIKDEYTIGTELHSISKVQKKED